MLGFGESTARKLIAGSNRQSTADLDEPQAIAINRRIWGNTNHGAWGLDSMTGGHRKNIYPYRRNCSVEPECIQARGGQDSAGSDYF